MAEQEEESDSSGESAPDISDETLSELIESQREAHAVQREELEVRKRELELNKEQAIRAIDAQERDRRRAWKYQDKLHTQNLWASLFVLVLVPVFLGILLWMGERQFALELVKIALYGGSGYVAGRAAGKQMESEE